MLQKKLFATNWDVLPTKLTIVPPQQQQQQQKPSLKTAITMWLAVKNIPITQQFLCTMLESQTLASSVFWESLKILENKVSKEYCTVAKTCLYIHIAITKVPRKEDSANYQTYFINLNNLNFQLHWEESVKVSLTPMN